MSIANPINYLDTILDEMSKKFPDNKIINIVCHGHSVPTGYYATPFINTFEAYPHLLHKIIKQRFPFAVINIIVTSIGGENSLKGSERFDTEVMHHNPKLLTIDYSLNDRRIGLKDAKSSWESMIEKALSQDKKVILLTPTWDNSYFTKSKDWYDLVDHAQQVRELAKKYKIGLADSFLRFEEYVKKDEDLVKLLSHVNHPSKIGHELVADELSKFFLAR